MIENGDFFITHQKYNPVLNIQLDMHERVIEWEDGRQARLCIATNVSERNLASTQTDKLSSVFFIHEAINASANLLFHAIDENGIILYINDLYNKIAGHQLKVGDRLPVEELYSARDAKAFYDWALPAVFAGEAINGELDLITKEGKKIPLK